jgi:hypothetical protein
MGECGGDPGGGLTKGRQDVRIDPKLVGFLEERRIEGCP